MRVLVTGAAGFIGSSVTEALLRRGDEVVGVDNFNHQYDPKIKELNLEEVRRTAAEISGAKFRLVRACLAENPDKIDELFANEETRPDVVCHLAARAGVRNSIEVPMDYEASNLKATFHLLEASRHSGVKPFVFASSSSVYGARTQVPFREDDRVDEPISPYAATKKAGELIGYTYHHLFGVHFTGLRFFTVYGPRQRPEMAIHRFAQCIADGTPIPQHGDGSSSRDYTYIDDIVGGVLGSIDLTVREPGYRVFNLGGAKTTTLSRLIELLEVAMGKKAVLQRLGDQPGDVPTTYADVSYAREALGYRPETPIDLGIPKFVAWFQARQRLIGSGS
jgi:UDP-glucuronate 4-epimerase